MNQEDIKNYESKIFVQKQLQIYPKASFEILGFIRDFRYMQRSENAVSVLEYQFLHGYCYYFAKILQDAFGGKLYLVPSAYHVVWSNDGHVFYDITGVCNDHYNKSEIKELTKKEAQNYKKI